MFSSKERCRYRAHQLAEVICQFRFPEILAISAKPPVDFQEAIRADFPQYSKRLETPAPKLTGAPGNLTVQKQEPVVNHQFVSRDGKWRINLTGTFISLSCSSYTGWEEFASRLDNPLASFIRIYKPAYFERVGMRYLNFFSRKKLDLEGVPFRELIAPCYLGPLGEEDVAEAGVTRSSVDAELAVRGGCRAKIHAGPGMTKQNGQSDKEVKFVLDLDVYMPGQLQLNLAVGAMQTLHSEAYSLFRYAITQRLHEAMEPEYL